MLLEIAQQVLALALTAAPWLLLGLAAAGLVKGFMPEAALKRWLGGTGLAPTARAAIAGAPLPLCSCGAIPTALALHRGGAGRGPTTAFLIGTPGVGVDSVAISYALLGPLMTVARIAGALLTAITTGLLVGRTRAPGANMQESPATASCCAEQACGTAPEPRSSSPGLWARLTEGQRYAFSDVLNDIRLWLVIGLIVAGALLALVPPESLAAYGSGLPAMLLLAVIGIPMYLCATAATPIAVALLAAGVSPGAVLVFLLAAPITSIATLGMFRRELGGSAVGLYLLGIGASTITLGLLLDAGLDLAGLSPGVTPGQVTEWMPPAIEWAALVALVVIALHPLRWAQRLY